MFTLPVLLCAALPVTDPRPPVSVHDLGRFPPPAMVRQQIELLDEERVVLVRWLNNAPFDHWGYLNAWMSTVVPLDARRETWRCLWRAHEECDPAKKEKCLRELAGRVGDRNYYRGLVE